MTTKVVGLAFLAALVMLAPLAAAEADSGNTTSSERPDDAAWVDDCPPDMMCAYGEGNVTRGPEDCEFCRDHQEVDCPDCLTSPMPADDDTVWGTDCPPGVYCMYDGNPEPAVDGAPDTSGSGDSAEASAGGLAFLGTLGLVGIAFLAALRRA